MDRKKILHIIQRRILKWELIKEKSNKGEDVPATKASPEVRVGSSANEIASIYAEGSVGERL